MKTADIFQTAMKKLIGWIKRHQIIAFFGITFLITGGLGFSYSAVLNKGMVFLFPVVAVATCGPGLAGIIVTAITNTQPKQGTKRASWISFLIALVVSALVCLTSIVTSNIAPFSISLLVLTLVAAIPVAFVISMAFSRIPAVKSYISSLVRLRGMWGWVILALVLFPTLFALSTIISALLGRQPVAGNQVPQTGLTGWVVIGLIALKFFYQLFFLNAVGEETGWRGFALPRMQIHLSQLIASLIISLLWINWHLFLWKAEGNPLSSWEYWVIQYALHITTALIIGWIYNRSKGSILVTGITHAAANTGNAVFSNMDPLILILVLSVAALVMILVDRMWKKLPPDHPAVFHAPTLVAEDQKE
jgi:membrane protease YdiL (CAAX protease family)